MSAVDRITKGPRAVSRLMLTAIVVGVSTLGVALAIVQKIHREYGSIEESEILEQIMHRNG